MGSISPPGVGRHPECSLTAYQRRVEAVRRFFAGKGVRLSRVQATGMGPLDDRGTPDDKKRRVTVTLMTDAE